MSADSPGPRSEVPSPVTTYPDVLATRYAGADLVHVWSPANKVVLERRLWLAVLRAQQELGIEVPEGVVAAYERSSTSSTSTRSGDARPSRGTT